MSRREFSPIDSQHNAQKDPAAEPPRRQRAGDRRTSDALAKSPPATLPQRHRRREPPRGIDGFKIFVGSLSITSSAASSSDGGTVRPSILAVRALMTSSNFLVGNQLA